jgi:hypothetical protein
MAVMAQDVREFYSLFLFHISHLQKNTYGKDVYAGMYAHTYTYFSLIIHPLHRSLARI